jgi:hypothetical protein
LQPNKTNSNQLVGPPLLHRKNKLSLLQQKKKSNLSLRWYKWLFILELLLNLKVEDANLLHHQYRGQEQRRISRLKLSLKLPLS